MGADDLFSEYCGFAFERDVKYMDTKIFIHALVRLAHMYVMFTSDDCDSRKTYRHLRALVRKLNGDDPADPSSEDDPESPKSSPKRKVVRKTSDFGTKSQEAMAKDGRDAAS